MKASTLITLSAVLSTLAAVLLVVAAVATAAREPAPPARLPTVQVTVHRAAAHADSCQVRPARTVCASEW